MELTVTLSYEGGPLSRLNQIAQARSQLLKQTMPRACAATMNTALRSLRAATSTAKSKRRFKIEAQDTGWFLGFNGKHKTACVRSGPSRKDPQVRHGMKLVSTVSGQRGLKQSQIHVYRVVPESPRVKPYLVAALNMKQAVEVEQRASLRRVAKFGGLARLVLSFLMAKVYKKSSSQSQGSALCQSTASKKASVYMTDRSVKVADQLSYATQALKKTTVEHALDSAARKTLSTLEHILSTKLGQKVRVNL